MREILYRGKRIDNGEWVYGIPVPITINCYDKGVEIIEEDGIEYDELDYFHPLFSSERVIPKSVSQFTGLIDKNGKKIFEGDIVKGIFYGFPLPIENFVLTIGWQEDVAGYKANYFEDVEVIGNIHDNPELIGG